MFNQDYEGQTPNDYTQPPTTTQAGPTATQQGLSPVPGHPGLYYNTAGVVFNEAGTTVDGYVNPATGAFQTGTPTTNPNTGIVGPPTTAPKDPVIDPGPTPGPAPAPAPAPTGGPAPTFTPPPVYNNNGTPVTSYTAPSPWSYKEFVAPNPSELDSDPAYQYTLRTEQDRIQRSAAARGILNTGGTINDLLSNSADIASAGYHDLFNRGYQSYLTNRDTSRQAYDTNYQTQTVDPYKYSYAGLSDQYNAAIHSYDQNRQYDWYGKLFDQQKSNDSFAHKYQIYSSL